MENDRNANFYCETISLSIPKMMMIVMTIMMMRIRKKEGKIVAIEIIIERKEIHTDFAKKFLSIFYPEAEVKIAILLFYTGHIFFVR